MKKFVLLAAILVGATSNAALPPAAQKALNGLKSKMVRTVVTPSKGDSPCELDYNVDLQVRQAAYDRIKNETTYSWETVKSVSIGKDGSVMEVCAE